ncbi:MAG: hypothetical protein FWC10_04620 [Lentimicrobiaceae bacterium]|nr:hypothetical protein [Lentimicrobiaceae bacterium]
MQKLLLTLLFAIPFLIALPQTDAVEKPWGYKGYAGGMFVHTGYVQSATFTVGDLQGNDIEQKIKGPVFGLGGKMGIFLHRNFRVGGEGYFSTCKYGAYKNSCRISWGGITFDLVYPVKKWMPFVGVTLGGGSSKHLIFIEKPQNNMKAEPVVHFSNTLYIINPAIGVEFMASNKISLLLKIDYMLNISKKNHTYPQGVRLYLGVHFYQKK